MSPSPDAGAPPIVVQPYEYQPALVAAAGEDSDGLVHMIRVDADGRAICAPTRLDIGDTAVVFAVLVVGLCLGWAARMLSSPAP